MQISRCSNEDFDYLRAKSSMHAVFDTIGGPNPYQIPIIVASTNKEFFNRMAQGWDKITKVLPERIDHILRVADATPGQRVLDVGTGTGILIPFLEREIGESGTIDAADISEKMLEIARSKFHHLPNVHYLNIDIEEDRLDHRYDLIIMYCMFPHLLTPIDTVEWLVKINLNEGGSLVIAFPEGKDSINSIHRHNDGSVHSAHLTDASLLQAEFEGRGLRVTYAEDNADYYIIKVSR